jgi:hypothetical protein
MSSALKCKSPRTPFRGLVSLYQDIAALAIEAHQAAAGDDGFTPQPIAIAVIETIVEPEVDTRTPAEVPAMSANPVRIPTTSAVSPASIRSAAAAPVDTPVPMIATTRGRAAAIAAGTALDGVAAALRGGPAAALDVASAAAVLDNASATVAPPPSKLRAAATTPWQLISRSLKLCAPFCV